MKKYFFFISVIFTLFFCSSCAPDLKIPEASSGTANFSKTIAIGGNFMAGYQDGALFLKGQTLSIPALLSEQFKLVGGSSFNQALMPDDNGLGLNSKLWESPFLSPFHLGYKTDCKGIASLAPINTAILLSAATPYLRGVAGNSIQNLAIPFANMVDYFNPTFGNSFLVGNKNPYYNRIASNPGFSTIYADAKAQNATFFSAWLGMEDVYNYASSGGTSKPISSALNFSFHLDSILSALTANGAKGVIATIPDFRMFPYYNLVSWNSASMDQTQANTLNNLYDSTFFTQIHFHAGQNGFVIYDETLPETVRQLHQGEYITLSVPLDSMKCLKYGLVGSVIDGRYILDSTEVYQIDQSINSYNAVITQKAAQYNLALVDMHSFFCSVKSGIKGNGVDFNADFVSGGFYSLDGYHPNQKGYALIANEFVKSINLKYNAVIPDVNCLECDGLLFP